MINFVDRTIFKTSGITTDEVLRRLDTLSYQIHASLESIKNQLEKVDSTKFTGIVYAVDGDSRTVALQVEQGFVTKVGLP